MGATLTRSTTTRRRASSSAEVQPTGCVFETALGWMALARSERGVEGLTFGHESPETAVRALIRARGVLRISDTRDPLQRRLESYAQGQPDDFLDVEVARAPTTAFQAAVVARCRAIPFGDTMTYGELASAVGVDRAARAVGNVMRTNRVPIIVPCHRVVGAAGSLGGYSMGTGLPLKQHLLDLESRRT